MELRQFADQLERCGQSPGEVRTFIRDFALVRLQYVITALQQLAATGTLPDEPAPHFDVDWNDESGLQLSGILPGWPDGIADPSTVFLHAQVALSGKANVVFRYLDRTLLSLKQRHVLFPSLGAKKMVAAAPKSQAVRDLILEEVPRLNEMLFLAKRSGMDWDRFKVYQAHLKVHGASQNVGGSIGTQGGILAVVDALREISPQCIEDWVGEPLPADVRTPVQIYNHISLQPNSGPRAVLLANHRAVIFASDPDVAVIQSLGPPYTKAKQALKAWNEVRGDVLRRSETVHPFAVGEIKTATDVQNLHERLALGSRETLREVKCDRFLLMSVLTQDILSAAEHTGRRRRGSSFVSQEVQRFSDVFNLYFAWGYDQARSEHPDHWDQFKGRIRRWCDL